MADQNGMITNTIRVRVKELLEKGEIAAFLGFTEGSLPMTTRPFVARRPEDANRLVWNDFCVMNLANYLPALLKSLEPKRGPKDPPPEGPLPRVGVLATGCWSRNIVVQMQENQLQRDRLYIIGVPSRGMANRRKLEERFPGLEIHKIWEDGTDLVIQGKGFTERVNRWLVVRDNCQTCIHPTPVISDEMIGEPIERTGAGRFRQVEEIESLSPDKRWEWFTQEIASCIRCYACRNACPLCYCPTCFVDDSRPQWVGKSIDFTDTALFHLLRAFHCAGRCTDCGACESACPMGIRMRLLTKKLEKDVHELFGSEPGLDPDVPLPLTTFSPEDPEDFIIKA